MQPQFCPPTAPLSLQPAISLANCTSVGAVLIVGGCPPHMSGTQYQCLPDAGYYGSTSAQICPYDSYCPSPSLVPIPCAAGLTAPLGSASSGNCTSYMVPPCRPGYFLWVDGFCRGCVAGCYCPGQVIVACDPYTNYFSPPLAVSASQCFAPPSSVVASACPVNTQAQGMQCRANAGYYFLLNSSAATLCPVNSYCPQGSLVPQACPLPPATCSLVGQYPTPSLCPMGGMASPSQSCMTCTGLPGNAYWTSTTDPLCPFCCAQGFYRSYPLLVVGGKMIDGKGVGQIGRPGLPIASRFHVMRCGPLHAVPTFMQREHPSLHRMPSSAHQRHGLYAVECGIRGAGLPGGLCCRVLLEQRGLPALQPWVVQGGGG